MMKIYRHVRYVYWLVLCALLILLASPLVSAKSAEVKLTLQQAVSRSLKHNLNLALERQSEALSKAPENLAEAAFEPSLFTEVQIADSPPQVLTSRAGLAPTSTTEVSAEIGLRKSFTTGTTLELGLGTSALSSGASQYQSMVTLTARQSLLRGISRSANLEPITRARLSRREAEQQLRHEAEKVVSETLAAYFDLHAALAQDRVEALAIKTAQTTLTDTKILIAGGKLAASEQISVQYTLQTYRRAKLQTEQAVADSRDKLARLIGMVRPDSLATPQIVTVETVPDLPGKSALRKLQSTAFQRRSDYLAALTQIRAQQSKVKAARHQLWPKLDLVASLFATGLSGDSDTSGVGSSSSDDVADGYWASYKMDRVGWSVGLSFELPLGNGVAKAELKTAELALNRAKTSADLIKQTIAEELNKAWRAVQLARDHLELTRVAEQVALSKLHNEEALYKAGKTTAHLLAAVQAEVVKERLSRAQASADLNKALVTLHSAAGNLLQRLRLVI